MIGSLFFWKQWSKPDKLFYSLFLMIFFISIVFYLAGYYLGTDSVINWVVISKNQAVNLLREGADMGAITLNYKVDNYLINESFEGSDIKVNYTASYILLAFIAISLVFYLTIITSLSRFWFIAGVILFTVLMINFKLDQLLLFDSYKNIPLYLILGLYLPVLYYFHAFAPNVSFFHRWLMMAVLTLAIGFLLIRFAGVSNPALYLVNYGILFPVIVSILFIFSVAIEVIVGLLYIVTSGNTGQGKNSLFHFCIVGVIYLGNVVLVLAKNRQFIDWDLYYVNEFYLLLFSAVTGIWGFKHRSILFENILAFRSGGALIYLVAGTVTFATIGYLFFTGNDPLVETFEDAIIFSHLSFGLFFFLYVISNFIGPLHDNLQVYKVVYKPRNMPYYVMRFIGLVGVGALFFQSGQLAMNQAVAGYYNGIGDLYMAVEDYYVAEQYYQLGSQFEFQNHRSNYGLASLANKQNDQAGALYYYQQSILKKPTPYAYANLANVYESSGLFFDALFSLKEGIENFPDNAYLNNNIGLLYARTDIADSAYLFLEKAGPRSQEVAATNILALLASKKLKFDLDSINNQYSSSAYLPLKNNLMVLNNMNTRYHPDVWKESYLADSVLNPNTFAYLYNAGYNQSFSADSSVNNVIDRRLTVSGNQGYSDQLLFAQALNHFGSGEVIKAFKILDQLQLRSSFQSAYYNNVNGLWALSQDAPLLAIDFFNRARQNGFEDARLNKGFAFMEIDSLEEAKVIFTELMEKNSTGKNVVVSTVLKLLNATHEDFYDLNDMEKFWWTYINKFRRDTEEILSMIREIKNPYYQLLAKIEVMEYQMNIGQMHHFVDLFKAMETTSVDDEKLATRILQLKAKSLIMANDWQQLEMLLSDLNASDHLLKTYLHAKIADGKKNRDDAFRHYQQIADKNPFKTQYMLDAATFFDEQMKDENLAYETILNASMINPYSIPLSKSFILRCVNMGLFNYAENELQQLKTITTAEDYQEFFKLYQKMVVENELNKDWE